MIRATPMQLRLAKILAEGMTAEDRAIVESLTPTDHMQRTYRRNARELHDIDSDTMATIEENNDKMRGRYARSAQLRRAFIGIPAADRPSF